MPAEEAPYVAGAWGKGPEYPHPPARAGLMVEPKLTTFTKSVQWEANTRAASQTTLDRFYASQRISPFATLGGIVTNPASPYATTQELTSPASPNSTWSKSWGTMSKSAASPPIDLANISRVSRNVHSYEQPEIYLKARGWDEKPGTHSQIFKPRRPRT
mmetsp:Transcript_53177/g.95434  ORF Transcript_53177/g.95434 Transcript_53177/m.95434 type:complete len:159 (+) Transcript_53177:53-529(+)|eukprot:CAMPEP_0197649510 /NCGR_PEP_ID=MMETSP1338-20131121/28614_1 /TAXON_ID=43686 ORGANISM="Pelagodinium beii, Strain RCC1491" /NCGR_SAMPLE_ID=MMETSP1338 /ASSEMBLY_ACC=CAM_ASM_000754 /LENGTH=158 /DNA_ID=CAMNT_0043223711 /DNA_START=53 /DNA_END=529 /DNA_ORIENTATION=-